jgi:hypothetical protein
MLARLLMLPRLRLVLAFRLMLTLRLVLALLLMLPDLRLCVIAAIIRIVIVAILIVLPVIVAMFLPVITLITFLKHSLCRRNDAVVVFGMLQVILSHHAVAGTRRITRQRHIFLGNMLGGSTNFDIRTRAVIASGQRVLPLPRNVAVIVVVVVIVATATAAAAIATATTAALFLLTRPHQSITRKLTHFHSRMPVTISLPEPWHRQNKAGARRTPLIPESNPKIQSPTPGPKIPAICFEKNQCPAILHEISNQIFGMPPSAWIETRPLCR